MARAERAKELAVHTHCEEHGMNSDTVFAVEVWHCYILGNEKWLFAMTEDGVMVEDYYEVTYNKLKSEFYVDHYEKKANYCYEYYPEEDTIM